MHYWWIFERKMEACWHQDRIKNRCQLRKADFCKQYLKIHEISVNFQVYGVKVGITNQSKIDQKFKAKMDCLLALIFNGF